MDQARASGLSERVVDPCETPPPGLASAASSRGALGSRGPEQGTRRLHSSPVLGTTPGDSRGLGGTQGTRHLTRGQTLSGVSSILPTRCATSSARVQIPPPLPNLNPRGPMASGGFSLPSARCRLAVCYPFATQTIRTASRQASLQPSCDLQGRGVRIDRAWFECSCVRVGLG